MRIRTLLFSTLLLIFFVSCFLFSIGFAATYKEIGVKNGGSISGTISFSGKAPSSIKFTVAKDFDICGKEERVFNSVKVNNGKLEGVIVYLEPKTIKKGKKWEKPLTNISVNQKGCTFSPSFQIMSNNQKILIENSDAILHNIHTYELIGKARKTVMNVSQPKVGKLKKKVKLKKGSVMKIECDAHDFMHANIFVAHTPYYSEGGDEGAYSLDQVPPGKYTVTAWHPFLGFISKKKIAVKAGEAVKLDFEYKG